MPSDPGCRAGAAIAVVVAFLCAACLARGDTSATTPSQAVFLIVANPGLGQAIGLPKPYTGYRDPARGAWVPCGAAATMEQWWTPFPRHSPPRWNESSIMVAGYWSWSSTPADHWSAGEVDAHDLGPGVRAVPGHDTLYYAIHTTDGEDDEEEIRLVRRVDGLESLLHRWTFKNPGPSMIQELKLAVRGTIPVLTVWYREGHSGEPATGGYDPFEKNLTAWPWKLAGTFTDTDPAAIRSGRPAMWYSTEVGGEATTSWSWGAARPAGPSG